MAFNPDEYVDVAERVQRFYETYPQGSLRCKEWSIVEADGRTFFVYVAQAFRDEDDRNPAEGIAWEPVPGQTSYTKSSEAMVCETSAWGRAIAALGFEVKRGIASRQEVMNRRGANGGGEQSHSSDGNSHPAAVSTDLTYVGFASHKQKGFFERLLKDAGVTSQGVTEIVRYVEEDLPTDRVSKAIDQLKEGDSQRTIAALNAQATEWASKQTDLPWSDDE